MDKAPGLWALPLLSPISYQSLLPAHSRTLASWLFLSQIKIIPASEILYLLFSPSGMLSLWVFTCWAPSHDSGLGCAVPKEGLRDHPILNSLHSNIPLFCVTLISTWSYTIYSFASCLSSPLERSYLSLKLCPAQWRCLINICWVNKYYFYNKSQADF